MAEFVMKHVRHPAYASTVATGVTLTGPTQDGLLQVTFFRELISPVSQAFDREERDLGNGAIEVKMTVAGPPLTEHVREDLVTVQIPPQVLQNIVSAFERMKTGIESAAAQVHGVRTDVG